MSKAAPLLLAMQLCPLDAEAGWSLLRLMADICPGLKYEDVDLLIAVRRDTEFDRDTITYVARRFPRVWTYRSDKLTKGWPAGCNMLAAQTVHWFAQQLAQKRWNYSGIFLAEADALPLRRTWLEEILAEWRGCPGSILGYHDHRSVQQDHINGNCIVGADFTKQFPRFPDAPHDLAWDYQWRQEMMSAATASRLIFNDYKLGTPVNPLRDDNHIFESRGAASLSGEVLWPAYLHGSKQTDHCQKLVRQRLLG